MWASLLPYLPGALLWVVVLGLVAIALVRGVGPEARRWIETFWNREAELHRRRHQDEHLAPAAEDPADRSAA